MALEVQASPITVDRIKERTAAYEAVGVPVIWVGVLPCVGPVTKVGDALRAERFTAAPWQRWAHDYAGGALWFFSPRTFMWWRGVFREHWIQVPQTEWGGGYQYVSSRWVTLWLTGPHWAGDLHIARPGPKGGLNLVVKRPGDKL